MKKLLFILTALFILTTGMSGCDKEDEKKEEVNPLIGAWEEKTPYYEDGKCDTIVFRKDGIVEYNFWNKELFIIPYTTSRDTVSFHYGSVNSTYFVSCLFAIQKDTLTMRAFYNILSATAIVRKDVIFTKVKNK